jgi:hypothetical protein
MSLFESKKEKKERLELERRQRNRAQEAEDAAGLEIPVLLDHSGPIIADADAAEEAVAAAREQARAARAAEKAARAAEIAAEIPEAQVAIAALTEYWEKLNAHRERHAPRGYYPTADLFYARPHENFDQVYGACRAASAAYEALGNMEKSKEYADYASEIRWESRMDYSMGGGKKTKYSRKSKSRSKYSRKSRSKYSRKSRSKYSRKY